MSDRVKLPVPGPWQPAIEAAMVHLAAHLGIARSAVAVTRVDDGAAAEALDVWLMAHGRTYRYVVGPGGAAPAPSLPSAAPIP